MLPPTVNQLAPSQRMRLVRSNRKLQAVLGATPQLMESSCSQRNPKKLALTLASNSTRSNSPPIITLASRRHSRTTAASSPDHLHISMDTRSRSNSASDRSPLSPLTPTTSRRRRMAKLARTLGENIPPELVAISEAREQEPERRRSLPERKSIPDFECPPSDSGESEETVVESQLEPVYKQMPETTTTTLSNPLGSAVSLPESASTSPSPDTPTRSSSVRAVIPRLRRGHKRTATGNGWAYRRELGWSGEWNTDNREEVLNHLRGLKL